MLQMVDQVYLEGFVKEDVIDERLSDILMKGDW